MNTTQQANQTRAAVEEEIQKLDDLTRQTTPTLYCISSVFPFAFFPTTLCIDKTKVVITENIFFASARVKSILIREITAVEVDTSIFLATLIIKDRMPNTPRFIATHLRKNEALRAQNIIQGLMIGLDQHIDVNKVPANHLSYRIEQLGASR